MFYGEPECVSVSGLKIKTDVNGNKQMSCILQGEKKTTSQRNNQLSVYELKAELSMNHQDKA